MREGVFKEQDEMAVAVAVVESREAMTDDDDARQNIYKNRV